MDQHDAWSGGIKEPHGGGILTRPFISGGWTWTGWDYRGEPTPYAWPNVNRCEQRFFVADPLWLDPRVLLQKYTLA
jgi:hypothetical protein